ncbi:cathepsin L1-like isoform X4 [Lynx canadensis]|uniref:cathepsin L1-like isoform X4 n=1 Tax=Lynx canadensis TaxID=61383 RepID=UPI0011AFDB1A|nr:cathepsin L1-like isoform X4 [Lynx canadensis]
MHPSLFLAALCLGIASAAPQVDPNLDAQWFQWKAAHGKIYNVDEEGWRRAVWETNLKMIEQHNREYNQGKHSFTMAMNGFGDMTNDEFRHTMNGLKIQKGKNGKVFQIPSFVGISVPVDRREMADVSPMKNQGRCASGWAFSATGALEGQMFRKTGKRVSLSVQNLLDCSWPQGNEGCNGGLMSNAFQYVKNNGGLDTEESYPYVARDGPCKYRPEHSAANVTAFENIPQQEEALMMAVANMGPISAAIDASLDTFRFYKEGIYYDPKCSSEDLNHGVLVVGYGFQGKESDNQKYWFVKNSWGADWGMDGYIKMAKDRDNHCGIATMASFPIV